MAKTIAIVIDDPDLIGMMQTVLEAHGFASLPCQPSRLDCQLEIEHARPDLVVIDVPLGRPAFTVFDARKLVESLRANPSTRDIPIIVCSTLEPLVRREMPNLETLGCGFIEKPFELSAFVGLIERTMRTKAA